MSYIPSSSSSGILEINTYNDFEDGEVLFEMSDDGIPIAVTTTGFNIINNHAPEILGMGDFHLVENNPLDSLITFFDEDDDSFFSIEMTTDEIEEPTEGDFGEKNDCSKEESIEEFCNNDGKNGDIFPFIINEMIDTVVNMEIKQGIK